MDTIYYLPKKANGVGPPCGGHHFNERFHPYLRLTNQAPQRVDAPIVAVLPQGFQDETDGSVDDAHKLL